MSLKTTFIKTALSVVIGIKFPEAVAAQIISGGVMDYLTDSYDDAESEKNSTLAKQIDTMYQHYFSNQYFETNGFDLKKKAYYKQQLDDILNYTPITYELLSQYHNDIGGMCIYLINKFESENTKGDLENRGELVRLITSIMPQMVKIISGSQEILFDALLQLAARVGGTEKQIDVLKKQIEVRKTAKVPDYPVYVTDLPYGQTAYFIGREEKIGQIHEKIVRGDSLVLQGIGGIGKTEIAKKVVSQIAMEQCDEHGISKIAWVDYDNISIKNSISRALYDTTEITDSTEAWSHAQRLIQTWGKELLLVIDNVENDSDRMLLKLSGLPCRILITSRVKKIGSFISEEIDHLSEIDCIHLFKYYCVRHPGSDGILKQIIKLADYHTVTIELLAKIANQEEDNLQTFLNKLVELGFHISEEKATSIHERLQDEDRVIEQIAKLFSLYPLKDMEINLLVPMSVIPAMPFSFDNAKSWFHVTNHSDLNRLINTGWLLANNTDKQGNYRIDYIMHSVIASAIRYQYRDTLYSRCRDFMVRLSEEMQYPNDEHGGNKTHLVQYSWAIQDLLKDHYQDETDADFMLYAARIFSDIANYDQAFLLLRQCIRIYRKDKKMIIKQISCYNQIGICFNYTDRLKAALTQYVKAFKLAQKHKVELGLWVALYTDAALVYMKLDGYEKGGYADTFLKMAYSISINEYGLHSSETRRALSLWNHCIATYDPMTARANFIKIIEDAEASYDKWHPQLAEAYSSYGLLLHDQGDFPEALKFYTLAFTIKNKVMGEKHPETLDLLNNIALINNYRGEKKTARKQFQFCLEAVIEREGIQNSTVASLINNIGLLDFDEGLYREAYAAFSKAEEICRECCNIYNNDFSEDISRYLRNEGECLTEIAGEMLADAAQQGVNQQTYDEIIGYLHGAIAKMREAIKLLMPEESRYKFEIAQIYGALASAYERLGWKEDTIKCFERAINDTITSRNENHPELAYLYNNYGIYLDDNDQPEAALVCMKKAEKVMQVNNVDPASENFRVVRGAIKAMQAKCNADSSVDDM